MQTSAAVIKLLNIKNYLLINFDGVVRDNTK